MGYKMGEMGDKICFKRYKSYARKKRGNCEKKNL